VPHRLDDWGADFAFWCSYKYLSAGPGAVGGLYLNRRHAARPPGLAGWFGSDKARQFDLSHDLLPAEGAGRLQIGTPHVLSMAPLRGALEILAEAGIERVRAKSLALTRFLMERVDARLAGHGFRLANPREDPRRGGHVALVHPEALRLCRALRRDGVVPDFRPPDIVRLAPVALYTSFADCDEAVRRLERICRERSFAAFPPARKLVP
jgi:kynureninase